ncbi:hypothetical protein BI362_00880 [Streptococcus parauberis]|uniref:hypothetical protein n=1 Tax=Streptococcus uberis TaxID=1349 RepID=UPI00062038A2|nr:hypothetical protein [Streptococcus uberis]KKF59469.1 hypothetical protein AF58_01810 [Streptococcus uberis C6344]OHY30925.1 hypothetical protein BI362_00880 [Streptococcus parauberis]QBX27683.1 hypothetical protein Javan406_0033 [Streptococcus phage Javan406]
MLTIWLANGNIEEFYVDSKMTINNDTKLLLFQTIDRTVVFNLGKVSGWAISNDVETEILE